MIHGLKIMTNYPRGRDVNERSVFMFVKVRSIWTSNRTKTNLQKINERTERDYGDSFSIF